MAGASFGKTSSTLNTVEKSSGSVSIPVKVAEYIWENSQTVSFTPELIGGQRTIKADVIKTPGTLTIHNADGSTTVYDGSENSSAEINVGEQKIVDVLVNGSSVLAGDKKAYVVVPINVSELVNDANYSSVSVSNTGTSENKVNYITIDDVEYNIGSDGLWEQGSGEHSVQTKGTGCVAQGNYSVAEGWTSKTIKRDSEPLSGQAAHAEGAETNASGFASHTEGGRTSAEGDHAHAEGYETTALGDDSHAEGNHTITNNFAEHAQGKFNVSHADSEFEDNNGTISSIGIGTAEVDPEGRFIGTKNAVEIMQNGDQYIIGVGGYDGKNIENASTIQEVINAKADDSNVVHKTGGDIITGKKIFNGGIEVGQTNYGTAQGTSLSSSSASFQILTYTPVIEFCAGTGRMNTGQKIEFRIGNVNNPGANIEYLGNNIISFKPTSTSYTNNLGSTNNPWNNLYLSGNISDGTNSVSVANIAAKANDSAVVHKTGNEEIGGTKSFLNQLQVKVPGITAVKTVLEPASILISGNNGSVKFTDNCINFGIPNKYLYWPTSQNGRLATEAQVAEKSTVSVSNTGTATDEVSYITVDGTEYKLAGGGSSELTPAALIACAQSMTSEQKQTFRTAIGIQEYEDGDNTLF